MEGKKSIRQIIYKEYVRSAILPMMVVTLVLLVMYFTIIFYIENIVKETLLDEAKANITEITSREVKNINAQINQISSFAMLLQKENSRFFENPMAFGLPSELPVFVEAENGVTYKQNDNGGSSVWYSNLITMNADTLEKAKLTEAMDSIFKEILEINKMIVGIYFNSYDSMNRYYPFLEDVYNVFEPNMSIPDFNFYYLADKRHNESREAVWTDVYLDPAGQGWLASCIVPIYSKDDFLEGVTGIDITINSIVENILDLKLPWEASAFLVDSNGVILAMPESVEEIFKLKELRATIYSGTIKQDTLKPEAFNLFKNKDPLIASQIENFFNSENEIGNFEINNKSYFITKAMIDETNWSLLVLVDKNIIQMPVYEIDMIAKEMGAIALASMLLLYMLFLLYLLNKTKRVANHISEPIIHVADKTSEMIYNLQNINIDSEETEIKEIHLLNENFNTMAKELYTVYSELENKVAQRTTELTKMNEDLQEASKELKSVNLQMLHQEKMASIGQLAAGVAHEINNPMGFIISNISLMQEYIDKLIEYMKYIENTFEKLESIEITHDTVASLKKDITQLKKVLEIEYIENDVEALLSETLEGTNRVKVIVQELKTFSRNEEKGVFADINLAIDNVISILWNELKYKVDLEKEYGETPLTFCHIDQLKQVFINILINASHAIQDSGTVRIKTFTQNDNIIIEISDTGKGIPENVLSKIFDPFFTTKETGEGTGLGLSISYQIIKSHEGSIVVNSIVGEGTTFTLTIPIVEKNN